MKEKSVKYTIEELRALDPAGRSKKEAAEAEIEALEMKLQHIRSGIADAAKNGEIEAVRALQAQENAVDAVITAKRETLEKQAQAATFNRETVKNSWNAHAETFNAVFSEKLQAFRAARAALTQQFLELCELQRQAVADLCHVNRLYSETIPPEDSLLWCDSDLRRPETLDVFPTRVKTDPFVVGNMMIPPIFHREDSFARALELCGDLPAGTAAAVSKVIIDGKPVKDPFV